MLKNLSKKLESKLKEIKEFHSQYESKIWEIVVYGSSTRGGDPRDLDILVLFEEVDEEEYYELPYELKRKLDGGLEVDVKGKYLKELFDPNFLPGGSIILEGYCLISEEYLGEKLNLKNLTLFKYSLKGLDKNQKTKFTYALKGRGNKAGVLEEVGGEHFAPGTIFTPISKTSEFRKFLERWEVDYEEYRVGRNRII